MSDADDNGAHEYTLSAEGRVLRVSSSLDSPLIATSMRCYEALSEPFRLELTFLSEEDDIDFSDVLGKSMTVTVDLPGQTTRYWNGVVTEFTQTGRDDNFSYYKAMVQPSLVRLALQSDCRIFQDMKVDDIVDALLTGITTKKAYYHADDRLPHNYRIQYRETDFAYVSRMMEEAGIFYYFEHDDQSHTMVLCDDSTQLAVNADLSPLEYRPADGGVQDEPAIKRWQKTQRLAPTSVTLRDTHFQMPRDPFESTRKVTATVSLGDSTHKLPPDDTQHALLEYANGYTIRYDGVGTNEQVPDEEGVGKDALPNMRADAERETQRVCDLLATASITIDGKSDALAMMPGNAFTLSGHFNADGDYITTRIVHDVKVGGAYASPNDETLHYENEFHCWPKATQHRPSMKTPKPRIDGVQTAWVVADLAENEADVTKLKSQLYDMYGRVKVRFPWDRRPEAVVEGEQPEGAVGPTNRSCWVRVAQFWAGAGWGAFFWPRHGNEVLVAFEHGDPDRPVIIGSVYNAKNMPPMAMPLQQDVAGIKSCSIQGNPTSDFNGITFHDELNNEHLEIQSEGHTVKTNEQSEHSFVLGSSVSVCGSLFGSPK